jgi:Cu(I)/Ag(I) efflux system membrane fusion protein
MTLGKASLVSLLLLTACKGDDPGGPGEGGVLGAYLAVGQSLANDDVAPLSEQGPSLVAAASGLPTVATAAGSLAGAELPEARTAFKAVSTGMIEYLRAHPDEQAGLTIVHCPMTFEGKGALWVQRQGKIQNPYEGSRMPTCGEKLDWSAELPKG